MSATPLKAWHDYADNPTAEGLQALLHPQAVFHSPVIHRPQEGAMLTFAYLWAATDVLMNADFKYVREFDCGNRAVLEFQGKIEGIDINGVDMIEFDANGKITDFKVMVRPFKGMDMLRQKMAAMLEKMQAQRPA